MYMVALLLTLSADVTKDAVNIEGTWVVESATVDGNAEDDIKGDRMTFKNGTVTVKTKQKDEKGTFKLDPSRKPKAIDITEEGKDKSYSGIYKLEGDRLTICVPDRADNPRPTEFSAKEGTRQMVLELKRVKK